MVDITDRMTETGPSEKLEAGKVVKRKKTAGEVVFDRVVYTGIGFGVNEASSLIITDQFMHGKPRFGKWFSKEGFDELSRIIARKLNLKDVVKSGKTITKEARAGNTLLMVTLLSGGTLLVLPMKWIEDNKNYWVKKANHWLDALRGNKMSQAEVAARDDEVEQAIACSPRQSWPSMLIGRLVAMTSSVTAGTLIGKERNDRIGDFSQSVITHTTREAGTLIGGKAQPRLAQLAGNDTFKRYAHLIGIETYSCAIASIVLEITSKLFARRGTLIHDPDTCREKQETPPPPPPPPPSGSDGEKALIPDALAARPAPSSHAAAITPASRQILKPAASHGERLAQAETGYTVAP